MIAALLRAALIAGATGLGACSLVTGFSAVVLEEPDGDADTDGDTDVDTDIDSDSDSDGEPCDPVDPGACSDEWACTDDFCDDEELVCVNAPNDGICGVGFACAPWDRDADTRGCVFTGSCDPVACDDFYECTEDLCRDGGCDNVPRDERCEGGRCEPDSSDADERGCVPATPCTTPDECDDGVDCTVDDCQPDGCVHVVDAAFCGGRPAPPCQEWICDPWSPDGGRTGCVLAPAFAGTDCAPINPCFHAGLCDSAGRCVETTGPCDDGVPCTVDVCVTPDGDCAHIEDDTLCTIDFPFCIPSMAGADSQGCVSPSCTTSSACNDGADCNGTERCEASHCVPGATSGTGGCAPLTSCGVAICSYGEGCLLAGDVLACDDGDPCTFEVCDPIAPSGSGCFAAPRGCDDTRFDDCCPRGCTATSDLDCR